MSTERELVLAIQSLTNELKEIRGLLFELVHKDELAAKRKLERQATCKHELQAMMGSASIDPRITSLSWLECLMCGKHLDAINAT